MGMRTVCTIRNRRRAPTPAAWSVGHPPLGASHTRPERSAALAVRMGPQAASLKQMAQFTRSSCANTKTAGFSLVELLVVIGIIVGLMATFVVTGMGYYKRQATRGAAELQVQAIASAIAAYGTRYWAVNAYGATAGAPTANLLLWDLDRDDVLDGAQAHLRAAADDLPTSDLAAWSWLDWKDASAGPPPLPGPGFARRYAGFVEMARFRHEQRDLAPGSGVLLDPWGRPYRIIVYDPAARTTGGAPRFPEGNPFGTAWCGVFSSGPDRRPFRTPDDPVVPGDGIGDDVCSWVIVHD